MAKASILTLVFFGTAAVRAFPASRTVEPRQVFGGGSGSFSGGSSSPTPSPTCFSNGVPSSEQPPCFVSPPITGGLIPPKEKLKRQGSVGLGGDPSSPSDIEKSIAALELRLLGLKNEPNPTEKELAHISDLEAVLKQVIDTLERRVEVLQNESYEAEQDLVEINDIKETLEYLAGVILISGPPESSSTLQPGKRQVFAIGSGAYSNACPGVEGAELALEALMHKASPTAQEYLIMQQLKHFLAGCGITIVSSPDGTSTTIKPSDKKRNVRDDATVLPADRDPTLDTRGIRSAYAALSQSIGAAKPSFATWLIQQHLADILELYGERARSAEPGSGTPTTPTPPSKRQGTITIGTGACELAQVVGLFQTLTELQRHYGDPNLAPQDVFLAEQRIVTALMLCGMPVPGWTTLTSGGGPVPGGPMTPDPAYPGGGSISPDPAYPGGGTINPNPDRPGSPFRPSDRRGTRALDPDAADLMAALQILESKYGMFGSPGMPAPIVLIMEHIITTLTRILGVEVPGHPVLGGGTVTIGPST